MILTGFFYYEGIAKGQWKLNFIFSLNTGSYPVENAELLSTWKHTLKLWSFWTQPVSFSSSLNLIYQF